MKYNPLAYAPAIGVINSLEARLVPSATMRHLAEVSGEEEFYRLLAGGSGSRGTFYQNAGGNFFHDDEKSDYIVASFIENLIIKFIADEPLREVFLALHRLDDFRREIKTHLSRFYGGENTDAVIEKKFARLAEPFGAISLKIFFLKKPPSPRQADYIIVSEFYKWAIEKSSPYIYASDYIRMLVDLANLYVSVAHMGGAVSPQTPSDGTFFDGGFIDKKVFENFINNFSVGKEGASGDLAQQLMSLLGAMKLHARGYAIPLSSGDRHLADFFSLEPYAALGKVADDIKTIFWISLRLKEPFGFHLVTGYADALLTEIKNLRLILAGISLGDSPDRIKQRLRRAYTFKE